MDAMTAGDEKKEARSGPTRRDFLKAAAVTAGAAVATTMPAAPARAATPAELAEEHAGDPGMLIDLTRCIGCGSCVAACKLQNDLEWRRGQPALGPEAELASANWTVVTTIERSRGTDGAVRYVKRQCLHCLEPACASACPVRALRKDPLGPVTYDVNKCIGCRYCLMACPFGVPTFEWDRPVSWVSKCSLCFERVSRDGATACAAACPTGTIRFGPRGELLEEAHRLIAGEPGRYVPHVYGETEVGGTSVLYVSDVAFSELGFVQGLPERPLPDYTWAQSRLIPPAAAGLGALLIALWVRRRRVLLAAEGAEGALKSEREPAGPPATPSRAAEHRSPGGEGS